MKVTASSLRKGAVVDMDGKLYVVLTAENIHPGKGTPVTQLNMRRISDGVKVSERWRTTETVERAFVDDRNYTFLYQDGEGFHFMNPENYDQVVAARGRGRRRRALAAGRHDGDALDPRRRADRARAAAPGDLRDRRDRAGGEEPDRLVVLQARDPARTARASWCRPTSPPAPAS